MTQPNNAANRERPNGRCEICNDTGTDYLGRPCRIHRPRALRSQPVSDGNREDDIAKHRSGCPDYRAGRPCIRCNHEACGWCDECHPEVPEWD